MSVINKTYKIFGVPLFSKEEKTKVSSYEKSIPSSKKPEKSPLKIAIKNGGGMGDSLIDVAFIQNLRRFLPLNTQIDYYAKSYKILKSMPFLNHVYDYTTSFNPKDYDLVMTNHRFFIIGNFIEDKIKQQAPILYKYVKYQQDLRNNILKGNNDNNNLYAQYAEILGKNRWEQLDLKNITGFKRNFQAYMSISPEYMSILTRYKLTPYQYITLNRGVDNNLSELCPKLWPLDYYKKLVVLLKERYPNITLIQVGASNKYGIIGADLNLLGKTHIEETKILLKNSLLHIDIEGGLVHVNYLLHGKSCVIFGPTNLKEFAYENNINIKSNACISCCWITHDWQLRCLKGFDIPPCMSSIKPETVMQNITPYLDNWKKPSFRTKAINHINPERKQIHIVGNISQNTLNTLSAVNDIIIYKDQITPEDITIAQKNHYTYRLGNSYNLPLKTSSVEYVLWKPQQSSFYQTSIFKELIRVLKTNGVLYIVSQTLNEELITTLSHNKKTKYIEITKE